jgi:hypothetical protein
MKPAIGAACCFALDTFVFKNQNQKSAMMLAGSFGAALFAAPYLAKMLPLESMVSSIGNDGGESAELRICEIGLGLGGTYVLEKYVLKQVIAEKDISTKLLLVVGSDFISEYISDYLGGRPLNFVSGTI